MNKTRISKTALVLIAIVLAIGASYVSAGSVFFEPSTAAPDSNVVIPVHAGSAQVKNGGLSVGTFTAAKDAQFNQQVFLRDLVRGGNPTLATGETTSHVYIGGIDGSVVRLVDTRVNGPIDSQSLYTSDNANPSKRPLCATEAGQVVLCPSIYAYASVMAFQHSKLAIGGCPVPGTLCSQDINRMGQGMPVNGGTFGAAEGYDVVISACTPKHYSEEKKYTVKWTIGGTPYSSVVTIYPNGIQNAGSVGGSVFGNFSAFVVGGGQSLCGTSQLTVPTGYVQQVKNICVIPQDPAIEPDPSQKC